MNKTKRSILEILLFVFAVIIDRITKIWAVQTLMDRPAIPIIQNIIEFYYLPSRNTGAAFGMLKGHQALFLIIGLIVVLVIGFILYNMPSDKKFTVINVLLVLIAAGGVGNMIDRFIQNYVVDFIYISCINFPIFNVADIYVSVSTVILAIYILFILKEKDYIQIEEAVRKPLSKLLKKNK